MAAKRKYSPAEAEFIRANFRTMSFVKIAAHLGRGHEAVMMKAKWMGLRRTAKERSKIMSGWSRQPKVLKACPQTPDSSANLAA